MYQNLNTATLISNILAIEKDDILKFPQNIIKSEKTVKNSFSNIELETIILELEDEYNLNLIDLNRDQIKNLKDLFQLLNQSEGIQ